MRSATSATEVSAALQCQPWCDTKFRLIELLAENECREKFSHRMLRHIELQLNCERRGDALKSDLNLLLRQRGAGRGRVRRWKEEEEAQSAETGGGVCVTAVAPGSPTERRGTTLMDVSDIVLTSSTR